MNANLCIASLLDPHELNTCTPSQASKDRAHATARCQLQQLATTYMCTFPLLLGLLSKHPPCKARQMCCMQGRTDRLDPLPQEMLHSQVMLLAPKGVTMFLSSYEKHTVSWHISWYAPQRLAAELNAKLQDPNTAQVGWQVLDNHQIINHHVLILCSASFPAHEMLCTCYNHDPGQP